jgi:peptidoglycan/xylan/chitin deacetylase (PgdA/CDA1 family)
MLDNPVPWPNGAKCAAAITFDVDTDTLMHMAYPQTAYKRVSGLSWLRYDEVAVPRIVKLFDHYGIKQTFFVPAWCIERYPNSLMPIVESGHEIAHHGYLHESPNAQTYEGERYWLERGSDIIERFCGRRPVGFRAAWADYSPHTTGLLAEAGFLYDSTLMNDSNPHVLRSTEGEIIELPIDLVLDDWAHYAHFADLNYLMQPSSPDRAIEVFTAELEAAYEFGGIWIPICHPMVTGRLARLARLARLIEFALQRGGIWFATLEEIALHVRRVIEDGTYVPRIVDMPYYAEGPIPELADGFVADQLALKERS